MKEQTKIEMQKKLADYRQTAPEVSWTEIEKAVGRTRDKGQRTKRWMAAAAAVMLIMGATVVGLLYDNNQPPKDVVVNTENKETKQTEGTERIVNNVEDSADRIQTTGGGHSLPLVGSPIHSQLATHNSQLATHNTQHSTPNVQTDTVSQEQDSPAIIASEEDTVVTNKLAPMRRNRITYPTFFAHKKNSSLQNKFSANFFFSGSTTSTNSSIMEDAFSEPIGNNERLSDPDNNNDSPVHEIDAEDEDEDENGNTRRRIKKVSQDSEIHHHQPIRFGLSLRYRINTRWSVGGGLSYTYLSSEENGISYDYKQKLHYIGIPLNASYHILSNKHLGIYTTAGGMVEKMVKGQRRSYYHVGVKPRLSATEDVSIHPLQFSLNASAGIEYNLGRWVSIYAEPGIIWYIDNDSDVPTFYQENPVSFDLNVGVRININQ